MKKQFIAALAITVLWEAGAFANQHLVTDASYREAWAARYENEAIILSTAGLQSKTLVVSVFPPDTANCSANLDALAQDREFIDGVSAIGFTEIECISFDDKYIATGSEIRKIVPSKPPVPFKPLLPNRKANA